MELVVVGMMRLWGDNVGRGMSVIVGEAMVGGSGYK